MPRQKNFITVIREIVREEVNKLIRNLLGGATGPSRRGRTRRGPGRPPGSKTRRRRPSRPPGAKTRRRRGRAKTSS